MSEPIVIGYSGAHGVPQIKHRFYPNASVRELAFAQGADSAAVIVVGGKIVAAAAEERFTGVKHTGDFPVNAIAWCLDQAGVAVRDVDAIAHAFDFSDMGVWAEREAYYQALFDEALSPAAQSRHIIAHFGSALAAKLKPVKHHECHAAYAFFSSGFHSSAVLVSDGLGESESASFYHAADAKIKRLGGVSAMHSIGVLYGLVTHYLGFWFGSDEYKVMGLAPYGDPARFRHVFRTYFRLLPGGTYSVPLLAANRSMAERQTYAASLAILERDFGPSRAPLDPVLQVHMDIAAALQECFSDCLLHTLRGLKEATSERRICLSGGCALNCSANGYAAKSGIFEQVYVSPAAGDDGAALGAALAVSAALGKIPLGRMSVPLFGHRLTDVEIDAALPMMPQVEIRTFESTDTQLDAVAQLLAEGAIMGWAQGEMEFGPRALGSRSILADARNPHMRDRINALVKKREQFRPFAPAVAAEDACKFFDIVPGTEHMYDSMLLTASVRAELPAVTHVDGSARVQVVDSDSNPLFWRLLRRFGARTGYPVLLNTSFNVASQPIVRTATEAVRTFLDAGLDALCIGKYLLVRERK